MDCLLNNTFYWYSNSGLALARCFKINKSQLVRNLPNPNWQYSKYQTRAKEIEKCLGVCLDKDKLQVWTEH